MSVKIKSSDIHLPSNFFETPEGATVVFDCESDAQKFNCLINQVFKDTIQSTVLVFPDMPSTICSLKPIWKENLPSLLQKYNRREESKRI